MLNRFCWLQLKQAADEVRQHWNGWLELVTKAERWGEHHPGHDPLLCIAIAWLSLEEGQHERRYRVLLGTHDEIAEALTGTSVYTVNLISIARLLHHLRVNAANAGITLPARLTVDRDEPGYADFQRDIENHQAAASARSAEAKLAPA